MAYQKWTDDELAFLLALRKSLPDKTWREIGQIMHRSANACATQFHLEKKKLGETRHKRGPPKKRPEPFMLRQH